MKIGNKALVELIGVLTVTASLVFVGMQLMLDRKIATAEQYFNRTESAKEDRRTLLLSPVFYQEVEDWWSTGERPEYWNEEWEIAKQLDQGKYSVTTLYHRIVELQLSILGYDNVYFQYQQGLINEESWLNFRAQIKSGMIYDPELTRAVYLRHARATIKPIIQEISDEIDSGK
ncbi:hypothetical protein J3L16_08445 [Alteromonas sp. 5E99-2]|uniref:hypothetical protein n=1 Tax=Alteromonas sp. 5E99-2 TaxID=2817683 RepID=UPI001A991877|nr:hypothetical protein [Alteromonas sp. 5E99-2]MBO1255711.1 hypothetical protein [Alteromonas sp. 5E99-2]